MNEIGKKIREAREAKGLTRESLAALLGVSPRELTEWESGSDRPDITMFGPVAEALDIPLAKLLAADDSDDFSVADDEAAKIEKKVNKRAYMANKGYMALAFALIAAAVALAVLFAVNAFSSGRDDAKREIAAAAQSTAREGDFSMRFIRADGEECELTRKYFYDGGTLIYYREGEEETYFCGGKTYRVRPGEDPDVTDGESPFRSGGPELFEPDKTSNISTYNGIYKFKAYFYGEYADLLGIGGVSAEAELTVKGGKFFILRVGESGVAAQFAYGDEAELVFPDFVEKREATWSPVK